MDRRAAIKGLGAFLLVGCGSDNGGSNPVASPVNTELYGLDFTKLFKGGRFPEDQLLTIPDLEVAFPDEYAKLTGGNDYGEGFNVALRGVVAISKEARDQGLRIPISPIEALQYGDYFNVGEGSAVTVSFSNNPSVGGGRFLNVRDLASTFSDGSGFSPRRVVLNGQNIDLGSLSPGTTAEDRFSVDVTNYVTGDNVLEYFATDSPNGEDRTHAFLNELSMSNYSKFANTE